jgi:hypothetical protein
VSAGLAAIGVAQRVAVPRQVSKGRRAERGLRKSLQITARSVPTAQGFSNDLRWKRKEFRLDNGLLTLMGQGISNKLASQLIEWLSGFLIDVDVQKAG